MMQLNASPTGAQQQTDYYNALSIYNNYLSSIKPVYAITSFYGTPDVVTTSGIYKILQFNTPGSYGITTTKDIKIYYVIVGGGGDLVDVRTLQH